MNITLSEKDHYRRPEIDYPMEGTLIRIRYKNKKRYYAKLLGISKDTPYEHTLRCNIVYKPAPKSQIKNKSIFSKIKCEIIEPKQLKL